MHEKFPYIRLLFISDLHLSCSHSEYNEFPRQSQEEEFYNALEAACIDEDGKPPIAVLIGGDIVHRGENDAYDKAEKFIENTIACLQKINNRNKYPHYKETDYNFKTDDGNYRRIYIVPGNHDLKYDPKTDKLSQRLAGYLQFAQKFESPSIQNENETEKPKIKISLLNSKLFGVNFDLKIYGFISSLYCGHPLNPKDNWLEYIFKKLSSSTRKNCTNI